MPEAPTRTDTGPVRLVVFDVDGVLIDSYTLVREAYRRAGITMSEWAWGLSWKQWLPGLVESRDRAEEIHTKKNEIYGEMLANGEGEELAGAEVARRLRDAGFAIAACSAASEPAILAVINRCGLNVPYISAQPKDKGWAIIKLMNSVWANPSNTVYIDDIGYNGQLACSQAGCHFVEFINDADGLERQVKRWLD